MQDANLPTSCSNHRTLIHYLDYVNSGNIFTVSWHCCPTQLSFCFSNPWPFLNKFNQFLYTALRHIKFFCWWLPWIKKELLLLHMMFQLRYCNKCWQNICTPWPTRGILTLLYLFQFAPQIVHNPPLHIPPCCFGRKCSYVKTTEFWKNLLFLHVFTYVTTIRLTGTQNSLFVMSVLYANYLKFIASSRTKSKFL